MTLLEEAQRAELIGNALPAFRGPNPDHVEEINTAVAEANFLGSTLRRIQRILDEPNVPLELIEDDLQLTHKGVMLTLKAVWTQIGNIGDGRDDLIDYDYRRTWTEIESYCRDRGVPNLYICLGNYRRFLDALCKTLKREHLIQHEYAEIRYKIKQLDNSLPKIPKSEPGKAKDITYRPPKLLKPTSFERERGAPISPLSPSDSDGSHRFNFVPGGSPPTSPPTTISSLSQATSNSNDGEEQIEHWAKAVFNNITSTPLPLSDERSRYHGPDQPTHDPPGSRYIEALAINFPPGLRVAFFYRPSKNSRAKVVVKVPMSQRHAVTVCLPLTVLEIVRSGCMLRICRRSEDGRYLVKWVSLQFSSIEMLVLFANAFIIMRAASGKGPEDPLWHDEKNDEVQVFAAVYFDDGFKRTLSMYRDKPSESIRLESSIKGSNLHGCPLWTSWITHFITSPTWYETLDRKTVILRDLRLHVFSSKYSPQRTSSGTYVFNFETSSSAKGFVAKIDDLGRKALRIR